MLSQDGPVLQTGQTKSYNANGEVVTDGSIKDDGYYRAGVPHSYSRNGDIVIDNATGLQWQDDVESVDKPWVTQENWDAGKYSDTTGDTATNYCDKLSIDSIDDWRLPSIQEFMTLPDASQYDPALTEGIFQYISSLFYWSSTTSAHNSILAWTSLFLDGDLNRYYKWYDNDAVDKTYVKCVRGGQLETPNFTRDDSTEIVTDSNSGLQWQDNDDETKTVDVNWTTAIDYCEKTLALGGYNDWRLPNKNELLSIVDYHTTASNRANYSDFQSLVRIDNWTSTTYINEKTSAWFVHFGEGVLFHDGKVSWHDVRCVRGGQIVHSALLPSVVMYLLD